MSAADNKIASILTHYKAASSTNSNILKCQMPEIESAGSGKSAAENRPAVGRSASVAVSKQPISAPTDRRPFTNAKAGHKRPIGSEGDMSLESTSFNWHAPPAKRPIYHQQQQQDQQQSTSACRSPFAHVAAEFVSYPRALGGTDKLPFGRRPMSIHSAHRNPFAFVNEPISSSTGSELHQSVLGCQQTSSTSALQQSLWAASRRDRTLEDAINPHFRAHPPSEPGRLRMRATVPDLPDMECGRANEVWNLMCWKGKLYNYQRDPRLMERHPLLQQHMRRVLLDWMAEVCESEHMHRDTFHLAVDITDRYMSKTNNVEPARLQLIGVTALFIASKIEEIYPPKLEKFAYVTDGACSDEEIRMNELVMMKVLNWALSPMTPLHWLTVYLQLLYKERGEENVNYRSKLSANDTAGNTFAKCNFDRQAFLNLARVLDLCLCDVRCLKYGADVLAASIMYAIYKPTDLILTITGFTQLELTECRDWLVPFIEVLFEKEGDARLNPFDGVSTDDWHNIQTRVSNKLDDIAHEVARREQKYAILAQSRSPDFAAKKQRVSSIYPTPPASDERPKF